MEKISASDLGVDISKRLKTLKVIGKCSPSRHENMLIGIIEPPPRQGGGKVEDVDGMIAKLKELGAI